MFEIHVSLKVPTPRGRLYYYRDPQIEASILYISSNIRRRSTFHISLKATIILAIDYYHVLSNVEIFHSRKLWKVDENLELPNQFIEADIIFPNLKEPGITTDDIEYKFYTDPGGNLFEVLFGDKRDASTFVALSEQCFSILTGDILVGFMIKLSDAPLKIYEKDRNQKPLGY